MKHKCKKQTIFLVLGNNEREERTVTYRKHGEQKATTVTIDEFVSMLNNKLKIKIVYIFKIWYT